MRTSCSARGGRRGVGGRDGSASAGRCTEGWCSLAGSLEAECEAFETVGLERIRGTGWEGANVGIEVVDTADAVAYYLFQAVTTEDCLSATG